MTKAEIVAQLQSMGETWANPSYSKEYLENYLLGLKKAAKMSLKELAIKANYAHRKGGRE